MTTLKELAALAGVHPSTVSRVVNGDPLQRVSAETRARIQALLDETNYQPDIVARSLRLKQTHMIAMVIPDVTNPLFAGIFLGVEDVAVAAGYTVILANTDGSRGRELHHLQQLEARKADGLILASASLRDPSVQWLRERRICHVLANRFSDEDDPFVGVDDAAGASMATHHLIELGHRRIAHLSGPRNVSTSVLRREGFRSALKDAGLRCPSELVVHAGFLEDTGRKAMERLLSLPEPPTAIFAVNDMTAIGAYGAVLERGLRIPEDVAIVGFNDVPLASRLDPGLSTVRVPVREIGSVAGRALLNQLGDDNYRPCRLILKPELIVRASTDPASVSQPAQARLATESVAHLNHSPFRLSG
jgi:LacI family transcriptional regulator